jgi:SpoVK/Ycf46/Vps4 family AAA+-type ATPase
MTDTRTLKSWNRCIPADLFDALAQCLPSQANDQISSFDEFESRMTGKSGGSAVPPRPRRTNGTGGLSDIAGIPELKEWLRKEILGPLQNPEVYKKYRVGLPNGVLFYGPPGGGKTYIARRLAEELGYFFQEIKPSDVGSPYIHSTVLRIRDLFDAAIDKAPAVVFIDEFDAFVPSRSELGGHQQYKAEEVNEFLANSEGITDRNVLLIAATNEPERIDPAIRRSGRFEKLIYIPPPDSQARAAMLAHDLVDRPVEREVDLNGLAAVLDGYSASDLRLLVDEAARYALDLNGPISTSVLLDALRCVPPSIAQKELERYRAFQARDMSFTS